MSQGAREARDHAMIGGKTFARLGPRVAAGKRDDTGDALVADQRRIEIRRLRDRQLEHHLAASRQGVEPFGQFGEQDRLRAGLVRALDRDLRLEDRHEAVLGDLLANLELLSRDRGDAAFEARLMTERIFVP